MCFLVIIIHVVRKSMFLKGVWGLTKEYSIDYFHHKLQWIFAIGDEYLLNKTKMYQEGLKNKAQGLLEVDWRH